jgi:UDP-3-O-[3-hydroxymyristoyl] glucosamine N-acyltransferase
MLIMGCARVDFFRVKAGRNQNACNGATQTAGQAHVKASREVGMKRLIAALGLLSLCACYSARYDVNPDGSKPVSYPEKEVERWPVVDGAHQLPNGAVRIYIDPSARFGNDVQLANGVRVGAGAVMDNDVVLFQNVTVGEETRIGRDAIVQGDVKIGKKVSIGGDAKIGAGTTIGDGAKIANWAKIGNRVSIGANSTIGSAALIGDGATIAPSQVVLSSTRVEGSK